MGLIVLLAGCGPSPPLVLLTYNVQNLFDAVDDGTEYSTYRSDAGWTTNRYYDRLKRLAHLLQDLLPHRPDIIVLEEIEGPRVIGDLLRDFLRRDYAAVLAPETPSAVRVAVLTRLPITAVRIHRSEAVAVTAAPGRRAPVHLWRSRELVDVDLEWRGDVRGRAPEVLRIVAGHWKSQSGGESETEPQRVQIAALIAAAIAVANSAPRLGTVIIGDLNEDVEEYRQHGGRYRTALMPSDVRTPPSGPQPIRLTGDPASAGVDGHRVVGFSPWLTSSTPGTYFHAGRWERLDQVIIVPGPETILETRLEVIAHPDLVRDDGHPRAYNTRTGAGYSDHLPAVATIDVRSAPGSDGE